MDCIVHISNNEITNKQVVAKFFKGLADGKYLVKADALKKRSLDQNAYYWGICVPMVKDGLRAVGYNEVKTNEDAHEIMKHLFLKKTYKSDLQDTEIVIAGSTTNLKTYEFNDYLEEIWQWASSYLGITIPEPQKQSVLFATYDRENNLTIVSK